MGGGKLEAWAGPAVGRIDLLIFAGDRAKRAKNRLMASLRVAIRIVW